jgi:hypothetical protein
MKRFSFSKGFLVFLFYFCCVYSCAQNKKLSKDLDEGEFKPLVATSLNLIKEKCNCGTVGFRYRIIYNNLNDVEDEYCDYSYDPVIRASDSLKIKILADLLEATQDTGLCCKTVERYGSKRKSEPFSKTYNLQIDALFTFNFIAFGVNARQYAPYPVLYDTVTNNEINKDVHKINEVVALYKEWYMSVSKGGFKNYSFPLINTRYRWYGGINEKRVLKELPDHPKVDNLGKPF